MCGIAGLVRPGKLIRTTPKEALDQMCEVLRHRGPDATGTCHLDDTGVHFGHTRLSILDLSDAGAQPMWSASSRYLVTFNGEIYNHLRLRENLNSQWRGTSDTETLLASFEARGIKDTLPLLEGMFAFAVFDKAENTVWMARDRFGEKPLYFLVDGESLVFGSELKAIVSAVRESPDIDVAALRSYFRHSYVPGPSTIYSSVHKVPAGNAIGLRLGGTGLTSHCYFSVPGKASQGFRSVNHRGDDEAIQELGVLLDDVVGETMISDVPLGAFLSGGIDSSLIVSSMVRHSRQAVRTFSVGFDDAALDEAPYAREVAKVLGTDHTEVYCTEDDLLRIVPDIPTIYDEPFADKSQIPTVFISRIAREHVTVALSGDGGDELFAGYQRYYRADELWQKTRKIPATIRKLISATGGLIESGWPAWSRKIDLLRHNDLAAFYRSRVAHLSAATPLVRSGEESEWAAASGNLPVGISTIQSLMIADAITYLPDDILVKVDRAAMSCSLETRAPLLNHRIAEFAWGLPDNQRMRDGRSKWICRELLGTRIPKELFEREKQGFSMPIGAWLRGALRDWAQDILFSRRACEFDLINRSLVKTMWDEHIAGRRNWQSNLWDLVIFYAWLDANEL